MDIIPAFLTIDESNNIQDPDSHQFLGDIKFGMYAAGTPVSAWNKYVGIVYGGTGGNWGSSICLIWSSAGKVSSSGNNVVAVTCDEASFTVTSHGNQYDKNPLNIFTRYVIWHVS